MNNIDRNKLLLEYEELIDKLVMAEKWAKDNSFDWESVRASNYNIWLRRQNIINGIKKRRALLGLPI